MMDAKREGSYIALLIFFIAMTISLGVGWILENQEKPSQEKYRQAKFVGTIETKLEYADVRDKPFYHEWLDNLKDRGYMWGE